MKKIILAVLLGLMCENAFSQVFAGGGFALAYVNSDNKNNHLLFSLSPEVGYMFGERWMAGGIVELQNSIGSSGMSSRSLGATLFGRYNVLPIKKFGLWMDFGTNYSVINHPSDTPQSVSVYLKPMLTYRVLDHLYLRAILDFATLSVGYSRSNGVGSFNLRAVWDSNAVTYIESLSIGAQYVF